MSKEELTQLALRISQYDIFASFFLQLPDADLVQKVREFDKIEAENLDEGTVLMRKYAASCKDKNDESLLQELAVDRTWLVRGTSQQGPRPPHESIYTEVEIVDCLSALNRAYHKAGVEMSPYSHERLDYLGVELAFISELCRKEAVALEKDEKSAAEWHTAGREFFEQHAGNFAFQFAEEMLKFARTDFYRGFAMLLRDFMHDDQELYREEMLN
jgi:putative dimethyl sulfoxide reductase chaperone